MSACIEFAPEFDMNGLFGGAPGSALAPAVTVATMTTATAAAATTRPPMTREFAADAADSSPPNLTPC